jgi:alcohol dehydrogenase class IV
MDLGVRAADIPDLAGFAFQDPCLATNPKEAGVEDIEKIYFEIFE